MEETTTLPDLLATQTLSKLAKRLQKSRGTVSRWANAHGVPRAQEIPALAKVLRIDVARLTHIVAADAQRIAARRAA